MAQRHRIETFLPRCVRASKQEKEGEETQFKGLKEGRQNHETTKQNRLSCALAAFLFFLPTFLCKNSVAFVSAHRQSGPDSFPISLFLESKTEGVFWYETRRSMQSHKANVFMALF